MLSVLEIFRVGIGPSSSHTVGPMRIALRFRRTLEAAGLVTRTARIVAHLRGSLAFTGVGHGSPRAVALGLLTEKQASFLVRHQHHSQPRLGQYFVQERILLPHEITRLLTALQRHNTSISRGTGPVPPFNPAGYVR